MGVSHGFQDMAFGKVSVGTIYEDRNYSFLPMLGIKTAHAGTIPLIPAVTREG